jgi:hypothetical protein
MRWLGQFTPRPCELQALLLFSSPVLVFLDAGSYGLRQKPQMSERQSA